MTDPEIKILLRQILKKLDDRPAATWVTAHQFTSRTGVKAGELRRMRENGTVKFKKRGDCNGNLYLFDASLIKPPIKTHQ